MSALLACVLVAASCADGASPRERASDPLTAASSAPSQPEAPWAAEAEAWTHALDVQPTAMGGEAWRYFLDPDVEFDYRSMWIGESVAHGERAFVFLGRLLPPETDASIPEAPALVSTDGVLSLIHLDWGPAGMDTSSLRATPAHIVNVLEPIGTNGAKKMVSALASDSWRERRPRHDEPNQADSYAQRWVNMWSRNVAGVSELYHPDAVLADSIAGRRAEGTNEIAALAIDEAPSTWTVAALADGTPAIYVVSAGRPGHLTSVAFVVDRNDGGGCPARIGLLLAVEEGKIRSEERFWEIGPARECLAPDVLPDGWWNGKHLDFSEPPVHTENLDTMTGQVRVDGVRVEIYNGSAGLEAGVRFALERYEVAGLPIPEPNSITFTDFSDFCDEMQGRSRHKTDGWHLYLCFGEADLCQPGDPASFAVYPQHILLHELAHVWLRTNLTHKSRSDFISATGLDAWVDNSLDWEEQASEYAAEVIAWGLFDRPLTLYRFGSPDDIELHHLFHLLTGVDPLRPTPTACLADQVQPPGLPSSLAAW